MQYIITDRAVTVVRYGGKPPLTLHRDDKRWDEAIKLVKADDEEGFVDLLQPVQKLVKDQVLSTALSVRGGVLYYHGNPLPGESHIVSRLFAMLREELPTRPMLNFIERLMRNPSYRAVQELLQFIEYGQMPLTTDGCFLAYKKVREDYKDIYTGKLDNSVGCTCSMPRNQVDEDSNRTCSAGLHVCSFEYLAHFGAGAGNRVVVVKVDPADVVAVPTDYNNTKMRVASYVVVDELTEIDDTLRNKLVLGDVEDEDEPEVEDEPEEDGFWIIEHLFAVLYYNVEAEGWVSDVERATHFDNMRDAEGALSDSYLESATVQFYGRDAL